MQDYDKIDKFILGHNLKEFTNIQYENLSDALVGKKKKEFIMVLSESGEQALFKYYSAAYQIAQSGNKLLVIYLDSCDSWKPVAMMLAQYRIYDVYHVTFIDSITEQFIASIIKREPNKLEQSIVHGWDITAFNEINLIITGISSLVESGDLEKLSRFISNNQKLIDNIVATIDYLKIKLDSYYLQEEEKKDEVLEVSIRKLEKDIETSRKIAKKLEKEIEHQRKENEALEENIIELKSQLRNESKEVANKGNNSIKDYPELVTTQIKARASHILYFKEIDKIPYINSFVWALAEELKLNRIKYKLLIYDGDVSTLSTYEPLMICGSEEFISNRHNIVSKVERVVVKEPNPMIIADILKEVPAYDLVIIYDRLKQTKDIVIGNEVTKYYVCSNSNMYAAGVNNFGIKNSEQIISIADSSIGGKFLDIPKIEGFNKSTDNAKISKYMKMIGTRTGENVAKTIFEKVGVAKMLRN